MNQSQPHLLVQRSKVATPNIQVLNPILYVVEYGCKWRGLPSRFGNWHTIYSRMNRWAKSGVLDRAFEQLQRKVIVKVNLEVASMDSTSVKVLPDGTSAAPKNGPQSIGRSRGGRTTKLHMVAADDRTSVAFSLSPGQSHDGPEGRKLLNWLGSQRGDPALVRDRAYSGDETRRLAFDVVPPLKSRADPWEYDKELYKSGMKWSASSVD